LFRQQAFDYGAATALTLLTRASYTNSAWEGMADRALEALSIANSHGYLRLMAESSFWAADLLFEDDPQRADQLFTTAGELFEAVGSQHWRALSYASRKVVKVRRDPGLLGENAQDLLSELLELQGETSINETSWAAAVLSRWIGVIARYARQYPIAQEYLDASAEQYTAAAFAPGLALARVGLLAAARGHVEIKGEDLVDVLEEDDLAFGTGNAPFAAKGALKQLEQGTLGELGTI
jgi:hypothetical protein